MESDTLASLSGDGPDDEERSHGSLRGTEVRARRVKPTPEPESLAAHVEASAQLHDALLAALLHRSPQGILVVDHDASIVAANPEFDRIWNFDRTALLAEHGEITDDLLLGTALSRVADPDAFIAGVQHAYDDPLVPSHVELKMIDGRTVDRHGSALFTPGGQYLGYVWFFEDISDRKERESSLQELALTDELTGVGNRRRFLTQADEIIAIARSEGQPVSLGMLDIDHFKAINDSNGHDIGNELLVKLARGWEAALRESDVLARIGGDEFAVLLTNTTSWGATQASDRLRRVAHDVSVSDRAGHRIDVTVSVGMVTASGEDIDLDRMLKQADDEMYAAKRERRGD
ncbi:GGDEF domain-containing protein [Euzebya tangerina]|uniref:GGDEF domain-containing protein n=1 Tax=Euzebya tangerina TaxID=591198 RepID=UPI000E31A833|nr:sensor domain-containing diguanylate cyclase [Euzebya tangerina]